MGRTPKPVDMLNVTAFATDIQHVPDPMVIVNKFKLSGDVVELGLESDPVCFKEQPSIAPIALPVLEVGGDSASQDPK